MQYLFDGKIEWLKIDKINTKLNQLTLNSFVSSSSILQIPDVLPTLLGTEHYSYWYLSTIANLSENNSLVYRQPVHSPITLTIEKDEK